MRGAIPQLPLYACTMWTGSLPLPITFITSVFKTEYEGNHKCITCNTYRQNSKEPPIRKIRVHTQVGLTLKWNACSLDMLVWTGINWLRTVPQWVSSKQGTVLTIRTTNFPRKNIAGQRWRNLRFSLLCCGQIKL